MRIYSLVFALVLSLSSTAFAQETSPGSETRFRDPTGGAYTSPTPLFTPAAALPVWMPRLTVGVDLQTAGNLSAARPLINAEVGLPAGFTLGAGTQWVGGDRSAIDSITPYAQLRYQIFGNANGVGWLGGASVTYKRIGYLGGENEIEASFSTQYRTSRYEVGAQATLGQSLQDAGEHDVEGRLYAAVRLVPALALGISGQVRGDIGDESAAIEIARRAAGRSEFDFIGGATASYTFSRWQLGALVGASTLGLYENVAFVSQLQGQVRF
jgi:hypothetical protein